MYSVWMDNIFEPSKDAVKMRLATVVVRRRCYQETLIKVTIEFV